MRLLPACLVLLGATVPLGAQPAPPIVEGVVFDSTAAPIAGATVTLRQEAVAFERRATTASDGRFRLEAPAPGQYSLAAERAGFSVGRARLRLGPGERREVCLTLQPGVFSEEVTVIGTRVAGGPEMLRRIPGSVDVLDTGTLVASQVFTSSEALRKASGVNARDEEGLSLRPNIGIRGLNPTRSAKTLLLEDGLPLAFAPYGDNASYYHPPIERFERIEVLKGSGQIAYGPVTIGGVVNYLTPDPPLRPRATLRLAGGSRDYLSADAQAGATWRGAGMLVDYLHRQASGARENTHARLDDANLKAVVSLGGAQTLTVKANRYAEDSTVTYSGLTEAEYRANPRQNPFRNDAFTGRRYGGSAKHSLALGESALLTTQFYAASFHRDWWRQSSNSLQRPNDAADPGCGGMANLLTTCGNEGRLRDYLHLGLEPRLLFAHRLFGAASEAEAGVRAHFETQERRQQNGDTPTARLGRVVEDNRRENAAWSAFLQNRLLLGRLTLTPGLRVEHIRYERTNRLAEGGRGVSGRTRLNQWVPGLGLAFAPTDALALFAGLHRGFAPPRTEDIIHNATGGVIELEPERSWNLELGLRSQPRPGLGLDVTFFRMDYENQIVPASLAGGIGATLTNGGQTLHQGLEAGTRLHAGTLLGSRHDVFVRAALTWLALARFEGVRFSSIPGFGGVSVRGNRLPYAPELLLTTSIGYRHPSGSSLQLELTHVGEQFGDDLNSRAPSPDGQRGLIPSHLVWNATLNVEVRRLKAAAFLAVKNLLDRAYVVDRSRGLLPGSPRLLQVGVVARF